MAPPATENLPPKKRKENRPPLEDLLTIPSQPSREREKAESAGDSLETVRAAWADDYRQRTMEPPARLQPHLQYSIPIMLRLRLPVLHDHQPLPLAVVRPLIPLTTHTPHTSHTSRSPDSPQAPQTSGAAPLKQSRRSTKQIAVDLGLTDKEVQEMEEISENQRKEFSSKKGFNADQDKMLKKIKTRKGNTKAARKSRERKLKEIENLTQQVEAAKKRNMENLALRTKKFLSKENSLQLCTDLIKKIEDRGEQVFCSGHHLLTDSCLTSENCDLTIIRI